MCFHSVVVETSDRKITRRGKEILYWHQRLSLRQPLTVTHKTAEQGLYGVFLHNNKLDRRESRRRWCEDRSAGSVRGHVTGDPWRME